MVRSGVAFDLTARSAAVEGKALPLTRSEYAICEYLALHAGQTFTKEQITKQFLALTALRTTPP